MRGPIGLAAALLLLACQRPAPPPPTPAPGEALVKTAQNGPIKATVKLLPKAPKLGDPLQLELTVEAEPQVTVEMPPFGEALGRFSITSFTPSEEHLPGGGTRAVQRYALEAPMSGKQRVPPLRVEYRDLRGGAPADGGAGAELRELLTEELAIDIASVLPEGQVTAELKGLRGPLAEQIAPRWQALLAILAGAGALVLALLLLRRARRQRRHAVRVNAYQVALSRLAELEGRGPPEDADADAWYVELSGVVRRYLEDRFGVRAPELTTEEFLREAQRLLRGDFAAAHRELLGAFLATCDQVKFAGYRPRAEESLKALREARRFLEETRPAQEARP